MFSEANLQHLGPRHAEISSLTWYESLLIARVHPVVSVITLMATGVLCYAGHVCNYYVKVLEWFRELPALLRNKKWSLVKRRKSIYAWGCGLGGQKKPTTANRVRLEKAIHEAKEHLPNVYADSEKSPEALEQFPVDGEQEMLEPAHVVDLFGEVRLDQESFKHWLMQGRISSDRYPCAHVL